MRRLAWVVLLFALTSLSAAASPAIEARARVEPPYVVISLTIEDLPAPTLTFDIGNFSRYVEYAIAVVGGQVVNGYLDGSRLVFPIAGKGGSPTVYFVFRTFSYDLFTATFSLPAPLVPVEAQRRNFSLVVHGLPSMPTVIQSPFDVTTGYNESLRYYIRGAALAEGPAANLTFSFTARLAPAIKKVERTLVVDARRVVMLDSITFESITDYASDGVVLEYPSNFEVEGVGGLLGPYPPTLYSITRTPNSTRIEVKLIAPPRQKGDLAYLWVKLSSPLTMRDNRYALPAFIGLGHYVKNLTVTIKARGELVGLSEGTSEGDYRVYRFPPRKLLGVEVDPYVAVEGRLQPPKQLNYPLIAAIFAVIAALGYAGYFALSRGPRAPSSEAVAEVRLTSELTGILRERVENLSAFLDSWSRYVNGKLSRQAYRQAVLKYRRREAELRKRARDAASKSWEQKLLDRVDSLFLEVDKIINKFDELRTSIDKGFITEKEGKKKIAELEEKLKHIEEELEDLISKHSEIR